MPENDDSAAEALEDAAERIANGHTKSWLQWTEFKPSAEVIRLEHNDLVWLLKIENRHFGSAGL